MKNKISFAILIKTFTLISRCVKFYFVAKIYKYNIILLTLGWKLGSAMRDDNCWMYYFVVAKTQPKHTNANYHLYTWSRMVTNITLLQTSKSNKFIKISPCQKKTKMVLWRTCKIVNLRINKGLLSKKYIKYQGFKLNHKTKTGKKGEIT